MSKRLADSEQEFQAGCCPSKRRSVQDSATSSSSSSSDDTAFSPCEPPAASSRAVGGAAACPPLFPLASLVHAAAEEQGARPYMEDAHAALELPAGARSYAVFDGHGGAAVADFCAAHLLPRLAAEARAGAGRAGAAPSYPASLRAAFAAVDSELAAGRRAHVCGSTAAVCVVTPEWLFAGNAGADAERSRRCASPPGPPAAPRPRAPRRQRRARSLLLQRAAAGTGRAPVPLCIPPGFLRVPAVGPGARRSFPAWAPTPSPRRHSGRQTPTLPGDSRVVLVRSDRPLPLTIDHSPARPDERVSG
jgi:serine/threonine protein phosphatase PrpC